MAIRLKTPRKILWLRHLKTPACSIRTAFLMAEMLAPLLKASQEFSGKSSSRTKRWRWTTQRSSTSHCTKDGSKCSSSWCDGTGPSSVPHEPDLSGLRPPTSLKWPALQLQVWRRLWSLLDTAPTGSTTEMDLTLTRRMARQSWLNMSKRWPIWHSETRLSRPTFKSGKVATWRKRKGLWMPWNPFWKVMVIWAGSGQPAPPKDGTPKPSESLSGWHENTASICFGLIFMVVLLDLHGEIIQWWRWTVATTSRHVWFSTSTKMPRSTTTCALPWTSCSGVILLSSSNRECSDKGYNCFLDRGRRQVRHLTWEGCFHLFGWMWRWHPIGSWSMPWIWWSNGWSGSTWRASNFCFDPQLFSSTTSHWKAFGTDQGSDVASPQSCRSSVDGQSSADVEGEKGTTMGSGFSREHWMPLLQGVQIATSSSSGKHAWDSWPFWDCRHGCFWVIMSTRMPNTSFCWCVIVQVLWWW